MRPREIPWISPTRNPADPPNANSFPNFAYFLELIAQAKAGTLRLAKINLSYQGSGADSFGGIGGISRRMKRGHLKIQNKVWEYVKLRPLEIGWPASMKFFHKNVDL